MIQYIRYIYAARFAIAVELGIYAHAQYSIVVPRVRVPLVIVRGTSPSTWFIRQSLIVSAMDLEMILLLLCTLCLQRTLALYEDQVGSFDW